MQQGKNKKNYRAKPEFRESAYSLTHSNLITFLL